MKATNQNIKNLHVGDCFYNISLGGGFVNNFFKNFAKKLSRAAKEKP